LQRELNLRAVLFSGFYLKRAGCVGTPIIGLAEEPRWAHPLAWQRGPSGTQIKEAGAIFESKPD
jgi:hypothetical protein